MKIRIEERDKFVELCQMGRNYEEVNEVAKLLANQDLYEERNCRQTYGIGVQSEISEHGGYSARSAVDISWTQGFIDAHYGGLQNSLHPVRVKCPNLALHRYLQLEE